MSYITFCQIFFHTSKQQILGQSLEFIMDKSNSSFNKGDMSQYRVVQKQVKKKIKIAKLIYMDTIVNTFVFGNCRCK